MFRPDCFVADLFSPIQIYAVYIYIFDHRVLLLLLFLLLLCNTLVHWCLICPPSLSVLQTHWG